MIARKYVLSLQLTSLLLLFSAIFSFLNVTPTSAMATCTGVNPSLYKEAIFAYPPEVDLNNGNYSWIFYKTATADRLYLAYDTNNAIEINQYASNTSRLYIGGSLTLDHFFTINTATGGVTRNTGNIGQVEITCVLSALSTYENAQSPSTWAHADFPLVRNYFDVVLPTQNSDTLYRNISEIISNGTCYVIKDDKTIDVYLAPNRKTYTLVGDKYYLRETVTETKPASVNCYNIAYVQTLKSPYDFITPFLYTLAIVSLLFILYFAYKIILYPFYRKGV